jgi:16S rRNA (cytidine1402-2'-O)-methyltransferase
MSKLVVVPTPIGNLSDLTFRAVEALKDSDVLLAEDTRQTRKLLDRYGIAKKKIFAHHAFNERHTTPEVIRMLGEGLSVALVSDAGTPGISDPGFFLVRECIRQNIPVECLPGPTAFVPALIVSGLPCDRFCFEGFLPAKKGRQTALKALAGEERTMVFYEAPHRLARTLRDLSAHFGPGRRAAVSRELTKKFEETRRGTLAELASLFESEKPKGEIVIVVAGKE